LQVGTAASVSGKENFMNHVRLLLKMIFVPVTLMVVPHTRTKTLSLRVPVAGIFFCFLMFLVGTAVVASISVRSVEYHSMKEKLQTITSHYEEMQSTMSSLKKAEAELRHLFGLKTRKDVLLATDFTDTGSLDMEALKVQINAAMESATDIKKFLAEQKDIFLATPLGWPTDGAVSSGYGSRNHPMTGSPGFHSGVDISVPGGSPVRSTADGIVSYSGWTTRSGYTVVVEHGHGFRTAYAHNSKNLVRVGQRVRRDEVIAVSGSTGFSTGPHVHYEIWKNGRHVNPSAYISRG
jgi:murein DD-endopeptidase MepM/ murein hydrolase activator NlpD